MAVMAFKKFINNAINPRIEIELNKTKLGT